jgi:hypothetical protein
MGVGKKQVRVDRSRFVDMLAEEPQTAARVEY